MPSYPSSLIDSEWEILSKLLPKRESLTQRGRPPEHSRRDIIDGILYIIRTGGAWRMMPNDRPNWKTCYHYFRLWTKQGVWEKNSHRAAGHGQDRQRKKKPRSLRSLTAKAFEQLATRTSWL